MTTEEQRPFAPKTIIVSHIHTDLDALGAMVGASVLYPGAVPVLQPTLDPSVRTLVALHRDRLCFRSLKEVDLSQLEHVIVVDTRSTARLGDLFTRLKEMALDWTVFDHHPVARDELPPSEGVREIRGSASSLMVDALRRRPELSLGPIEATLMALGIYADTGSLLYPSTTVADVEAVAWLLAQGADLVMVAKWLESVLSEPQKHLLERLLEEANPRAIRGVRSLVVGADTPIFVSGLAQVADKLQAIFDVEVVILAVEMEGRRTQIVGRSQNPGLDLRLLLQAYSPAGHTGAASAHLKYKPYGEVVAETWQALETFLPPEPVARDLMSSPVRTIEATAPAEDAIKLLDDHGHNALVVTREGRLAGVIARRDLERASRHGLKATEVRHLMTSTVVTTTPEASLSEILHLFVERDIGRVPVVRDGAMIGIVTRSDILRAQYDQAPTRRAAIARSTREMTSRLRSYWPPDWLEAFEQLTLAAEGQALFLVGGAVRDLLLGRPNLDADFVVEGDAIEVAKRFVQGQPGATFRAHPTFGTAHIYLADGKTMDVASARTEHYESPGTLPRVAFSSIKQDLARRDFSINCLAIRIDSDARGELIDFFDAQNDIKHRELRVLHNLSFIEDPTRVLRAVRFEQTLGFHLEARTEEFARFAFATGAFDAFGGERNKLEISRLLSTRAPLKALERLNELGALRLLSPELTLDDTAKCRLRRLHVTLRRMALEDTHDRWLAWLAVCIHPLGADRVRTLCEKLNLAGKQISQIEKLETLAHDRDIADKDSLAMVELLRPLSIPMLAALYACTTERAVRRAVLTFFFRWRHISLRVSGRDLQHLGVPAGPEYSRIFNQLLALRLDGRIGADDELTWLNRLAQQSEESQDVR
ncbi:MAG: CBS domain-containing protein [Candidatus Sericytochromatia bacterium]|nr:CBS domain-containing protein [Candidatus Sericytochromatia bacterium]